MLVQDLRYAVRQLRRAPGFAVAAVLCLVAIVACFLPARRAAAVEPMQALRTE